MTPVSPSPVRTTPVSSFNSGDAASKRPLILIGLAALVLFCGAALLLGLPGADTNAPDTYNVITRLARTFTYQYSRTPGQPFLDYLNFLAFSAAGERGVQAWYLLISTLGIVALYRLVRDCGGTSPLLAAATLAIHPLFLTHVGGVGDFAVSSSFLLIALWAGAGGMTILAGLALAMAVGCRFVFCLYVIPLLALIAFMRRQKGESWSSILPPVLKAGTIAAGVSIVFYAPLFAFWGRALLVNFPLQSLKYHLTAFGYKMMIGLGLAFWAIIACVAWTMYRRHRASQPVATNSALAICAVLLAACASLILLRVPTKPELTIPVLISGILLVQVAASKRWAQALALSSVLAGLVVISPYDSDQGTYGFFVDKGWYATGVDEAFDNRLRIDTVRATLAQLPPRSIVVARTSWTAAQGESQGVRFLNTVSGVSGLAFPVTFDDLGGDRIIVDIHEPKLPELLEQATSGPEEQRRPVFYDPAFLSRLRRWNNLDLAKYGRPIHFAGDSFAQMWRAFGKSSVQASLHPAPSTQVRP
jgi:hypothetical protein